MKERFLRWFGALQPRERYVLGFGAGFVVLTFVYLLVEPLFSGVAGRAARVQEKEALLAWMVRSAAGLPQARTGTEGDTAPVVIIGRSVEAAGIGSYMKQTQPVGEHGVRTQFEGVPFDALMQWLAMLASEHGLVAASVQLDAGDDAGTVDARLSLERAGS